MVADPSMRLLLINSRGSEVIKMILLAQGGAFDDGMTGAIDIGDKEVNK